MRWIVELTFRLLALMLSIPDLVREEGRSGPQRRHFLLRYLIGLGIALLVLAGLAGLGVVLVRVSDLTALVITVLVLAGLFGLMIVLVRFYRWP